MAFFRNDIVCYLDHDKEKAIYGCVQCDFKKPQNAAANRRNQLSGHNSIRNSFSSGNADSLVENYISEYPVDYTFPQENEVNVQWLQLHNWIKYETDSPPAPTPSCPAAQLHLVDRRQFVRDIVRDVKSQNMGLVLKTHVQLNAKILGLNAVLFNLDRSLLEVSVPFDPSVDFNLVEYKGVVGHITDPELHYILRFSDGARIRVHESAVEWFKLVDREVVNNSSDDEFYENAVIQGDARNLTFYNPDSVIQSYPEEKADESEGRPKDFLPLFLTETRRHNALVLFQLRKRTPVTVLVEKRIVVAARFCPSDSSSFGLSMTKLFEPDIKELITLHPRPWELLNLRDISQYTIRPGDKIYNISSPSGLEDVVYRYIMKRPLQPVELNASTSSSTSPNEQISKKEKDSSIHITTPPYIQRFLFRLQRPRFTINPLRNLRQSRIRTGFRSGRTRHYASYSKPDSDDEMFSSAFLEASSTSSREKLTADIIIDLIDYTNPLGSEGGFPRIPLVPGTRVPVLIFSTTTAYDIIWQDGRFESSVPTERLQAEYLAPDEHLFMPGDLIRLKSEMKSLTNGNQDEKLENGEDEGEHSFGIISSVDSKEMLCRVRWFAKTETPSGIQVLVPKGPSEEAGVYEVVSSPETRYYVGDIVTAQTEQESGVIRQVTGYVEDIDFSTGSLILSNKFGENIQISQTQCNTTIMEDAYGSGSIDASSTIDLDQTSTSFYDNLFDHSENEDDSLEEECRSAFGETDAEDEYESSDDWKTVDEYEEDSDIEILVNTLNKFWICNSFFLKKIFLHIDALVVNINALTFLLDVCSVKLPPFEENGEGQVVKLARLMQTPLFPSYWTLENQLMCLGSALDLVESSYRIVYRDHRDFRLRRLFKMTVKLKRWLRQQDCKSQLFQCSCVSATAHMGQLEANSGEISARVIEYLTVNEPCPVEFQLSQFFSTEVSWPLDQRKTCDYTLIKTLVNSINDIHRIYEGWMAENADNLIEGPLPSESELAAQGLEIMEAVQNQSLSIHKVCEHSPVENGNPESPINSASENDHDKDVIQAISPESPNLSPNITEIPEEHRGVFVVVDEVLQSHAFFSTISRSPKKAFLTAWRRDHELLSTSLPKGIIVKAYEDRMDLYSVMIVGPAGTPYEGGLFFFDLQLQSDYPETPPEVFYHSLAAERINPNLYVEGRVCLSLLGTWNGKKTENWNPRVSNLLQVVVSLQGLILNSEPFFNEAGYDAIRTKSDASDLSRAYNEGVVASLLQSMVQLVRRPMATYKKEILVHFRDNIDSYSKRLLKWVTFDEAEVARLKSKDEVTKETDCLPEFPLVPISKGFCISVQRHVKTLVETVRLAQSELEDDNMFTLP